MEIEENRITFNNLVDVSQRAGEVLGEDTTVQVSLKSAESLKQENAHGESVELELREIGNRARQSGERLRSLFASE